MNDISFERLDISELREIDRIDGEIFVPGAIRLTYYVFEDVDIALVSIVAPFGYEFAFFGGIDGKLSITQSEWNSWDGHRKDAKIRSEIYMEELKRKKIPERKRGCIHATDLPQRTLIRFMFPVSALESLRHWIARHLNYLGEKAFVAPPCWKYGLEALTPEILNGNFSTKEVLRITDCPWPELVIASDTSLRDIGEEERITVFKKLLEEHRQKKISFPLTMVKALSGSSSFWLSESELLRAEVISQIDSPHFFNDVIRSISRYIGWEGVMGRSVKLKSPLIPKEIYKMLSAEQLARREPLLNFLNCYVSNMLSIYPTLGEKGEWLLACVDN